ncbi:FtsK/SpoIIIE domain-containing protein [Amycolatopsis sp. H20-H5]|uniref:FtsK/SpoIIIE domain-containing protein n=1 Tax=Amycolatopsis sp. H20-H5 TaxID=3046309 RepID=UPI002DB88A29|nr:FtsK/SpoIIIE domain-containing protein [Amycolatopsis sp. H20-H5]MEC3977167.1 FtsK/SpoIIIE domain-containing protein [Amycolatopsis sp. H20-H5]
MTFYPLAPSEMSPDWLPHAKVIGLESDRQYGVAVLEHLYDEFARRARIIKPYGDNIAAYRRKVPDATMPRVVAIIDEFHVLFEEDDATTARAVQLLERLARRGRAYGIHLVLASQTISGITSLMAKQDGIFSQFPIRVALKNSASESRAVLDPHNSEAARLRFRGEAVVNVDFGQPEGNRRAIIAAADPAEMERLRHGWWSRREPTAEPPAVFNGGESVTLLSVIPNLIELRARARVDQASPTALVGTPIAVARWPVGAALPATPGRHLAVVGAGKRAVPYGASRAIEPDLAVGALHTAAISLALQHPRGDAQFTILNYLGEAESKQNGMPYLVDVLQHLGFTPVVHSVADATAALRQIAKDLTSRVVDSTTAHYVLAVAVDRAGTLENPDEMFAKPVDDLRSVLRDGPARRTHVLGWWSSVGMFKSHLGYDAATGIDTILALRVEQRDVTDLMGHSVAWSPQDNRGLLFDRTQLAQPVAIVPIAPLDHISHAVLLRTEWDQR